MSNSQNNEAVIVTKPFISDVKTKKEHLKHYYKSFSASATSPQMPIKGVEIGEYKL